MKLFTGCGCIWLFDLYYPLRIYHEVTHFFHKNFIHPNAYISIHFVHCAGHAVKHVRHVYRSMSPCSLKDVACVQLMQHFTVDILLNSLHPIFLSHNYVKSRFVNRGNPRSGYRICYTGLFIDKITSSERNSDPPLAMLLNMWSINNPTHRGNLIEEIWSLTVSLFVYYIHECNLYSHLVYGGFVSMWFMHECLDILYKTTTLYR